MTLNIQLTPDLEARLLQQAASAGMDASEFVASTLALQLVKPVQSPAHCGKDETELMSAINEGLPEQLWRRYRALVALRETESLSAEEHLELIRLSDQIEEDHARRMEHLAKLASLRHLRLDDLMNQMGIRQPHA